MKDAISESLTVIIMMAFAIILVCSTDLVTERLLNHTAHADSGISKETEEALILQMNIAEYIRSKNNKISKKAAKSYAKTYISTSDAYGIDVAYLIAITDIESTFKSKAKSKRRCIGLMQVSPNVWLDRENEHNLIDSGIVQSKKDLYNPNTNIKAGAHILRHYMDKAIDAEVKNVLRYALNRYVGLPRDKNGKRVSSTSTSREYYRKFKEALREYREYNPAKYV